MSPNVGGALPTSSEHYVGQADAPILISSYIFAFRENNGGIDATKSPVRSAGPSPNRGLACVAVQRSRQTQPLTPPSPTPGRGRNRRLPSYHLTPPTSHLHPTPHPRSSSAIVRHVRPRCRSASAPRSTNLPRNPTKDSTIASTRNTPARKLCVVRC